MIPRFLAGVTRLDVHAEMEGVVECGGHSLIFI